MKKLAKLQGVKALDKNEQKSINGGLTDLCTICGWVTLGYMTCFSPIRGRYNVPCDER